jgi:hypothetical protein
MKLVEGVPVLAHHLNPNLHPYNQTHSQMKVVEEDFLTSRTTCSAAWP